MFHHPQDLDKEQNTEKSLDFIEIIQNLKQLNLVEINSNADKTDPTITQENNTDNTSSNGVKNENNATNENNVPNEPPKELDRWDKYNLLSSDPTKSVGINGVKSKYLTYTHYFFEKLNLDTYLNTECNYMLQLGCAVGHFIKPYKERGWNVMGYDNSSIAINFLHENNIPAKKINLNELNDSSTLLACDNEITNDLKCTSNVLAIRILQYLDIKPMCMLLNKLIDSAQDDTVFFFVNAIFPKYNPCNVPDGHKIPRNYVISFFIPRTDMKILLSSKTDEDDKDYVPGNDNDEVFICKKIARQ